MQERWIMLRAGVLAAVVLLLGVAWVPVWGEQALLEDNFLTVRFLNVGQGDAIHVMTPDGHELLIDGGASAAVLRELAKGRSFFDTDIDIVVATHPDTDHVGGLVDVLERFDVEVILETEAESESAAAEAFLEAAGAEGAPRLVAEAGQIIQLGASTTVRVLSPHGDTSNWQSNTASIVLHVTYGNTSFMLTGDAPVGIEDYLAGAYGAGLKSNVLKLGHHGSDTSTSELFLDTVDPEYAIVSAGVGNRYGHPHQDVMQRVFARNIRTFHTGTDGTITFKSDGQTVWVE